MVQSTLTCYLEVDEGQPPGPENTLQRIEDVVKKILLKMDAMNIQDYHEHGNVENNSNPNVGDVNVKAAKNLIELANCEQVHIEILRRDVV